MLKGGKSMGSQSKPPFHLTCTVACTALSSCPALAGARRLRCPGDRSLRNPWKGKLAAVLAVRAERVPKSLSSLLGRHVCREATSPAARRRSRATAAGCVDRRNASQGAAAACPSTAEPWYGRACPRQHPHRTATLCPVPTQRPGGAALQTAAALGDLGQPNCLVKYKWPGDFLKLEERGKPLRGE